MGGGRLVWLDDQLTPPTAKDVSRLRRSATMATTVPSTAVIALIDELERLRDLSERRLMARGESVADAIEATISESGAETIDELRAAVRGRLPSEPWDGEQARTEGELRMPTRVEELFPDAPADPRVERAAALLLHYLRPEAASEVVQRRDQSLDGRTLAKIAVDDPSELLQLVRHMFDLHRLDADLDAKISRRANSVNFADELLAGGQAVVYLDGDDIVRKHPDDTCEVVGRVEDPPDENG